MRKIALVGNPNSGKSSLFNKLTGLRQKVANFPGVTVEVKTGIFTLPNGEEVRLIDLPGAYSLYPNSEDERVVLNVLANPEDENYPDAIIYVADVTHLEKHLLLLTQVHDLGIPCLLALNMLDVAEGEGLKVDLKKLMDFLGMTVMQVSGRRGDNIDQLKQEAGHLLEGRFAKQKNIYELTGYETEVASEVARALNTDNLYLAKLLAHHHARLPFFPEEKRAEVAAILEKAGFQNLQLQISETMARFGRTSPVLQAALKKEEKIGSLTERLDKVFTHPIFAPLIFFGVMFFVFQSIFAWAEMPMDWIDAGFGALSTWLGEVLPAGWFTDLLTEGIIAGLGGIVIFVPQIALLFLLITILEEVGYMARSVFIFDKIMQQFGLNGRSVVALISSGACAIPAVMSTRTIGNWKERLITIMVTPLISCSARIPVYAVLVALVVPATTVWGFFNMQGLVFMGLYVLGVVAALASAFVFNKILKSEERSWLMMEMPPYRMPVWRNVWQTVYEKVGAFVVEAGKVILAISMVLWFLASYGPSKKMAQAELEAMALAEQRNLDEVRRADLVAGKRIEASYAGHIGKFIEPAIEPLGFDWKIGIALVTSFAAREVFVGTMATIYSIGSVEDEVTIRERLAAARDIDTGEKTYTPATALSLLIFYVFAMQCMSTLAVVKRETGSWKWAAIQFGYMTALAYSGSLLTYQLMS